MLKYHYINCRKFCSGGVAQLVERLNGIQEVRGSTPLISTKITKVEPERSSAFVFENKTRGVERKR